MSWSIDPTHAQITFSARHMMIMSVRGRFEKFHGTVEFDENDFTRSSINVKIEAASINTDEAKRDGHLRSPDFLDAENYPTLDFTSKQVKAITATRGQIVGDLTIRGVTREVVLDVEYLGQSKSPWGTLSAGFSAQTKINRKDWGLEWNVALETGGVLVSDEVTIHIDVELVKQAESETEAEAVAA